MHFLHLVTFLLSLLTLATSQALSPCPTQHSSLQSRASAWPKPTGDLSSYISSYSSAHNGVFSSCGDFIGSMPPSLTSGYSSWATEVSTWSTSLESTVSAAQETCLALVVVVVITDPYECTGADGGSVGTAVSSTGSSAAATSTAASAQSSANSGAGSHGTGGSGSGSVPLMVMVVGAGLFGVLAIAL